MQQEQFQLHFEIEEKHWWFQGRRAIIGDILRDIVPPSQGTLVLDVGCGTGGNLIDLRSSYRVAGCDISAQAISFARQKLTGLDFIVGYAPDDVQRWMQQAHVILLLDVLEHVEEDKAFVRELWLSMSPDSLLVITVPAGRRLWSPHDNAFGHLRRYDLTDVQHLVAPLSGNRLLTSYFSSRLYPIIRIVRQVTVLFGKSAGRVGTDFWMTNDFINMMLYKIFHGEIAALKKCLNTNKSAYPFGSSLICILKKKENIEEMNL